MKKNTVLIVEDEPRIAKLLTIALESIDCKAVACTNGREAVRLAASIHPELILVDLGLPDMDGKDVIKHIREWSTVPIIVCTVRSDDSEMIRAFELGADDYVTKPFNPDVLMARVQACLRKAVTKDAGEPELVNGRIRMDLVRHEVFLGEEKVTFKPREYDLLRYFMIHRGKMLLHKQILHDIWGAAHTENVQYLRVYIGQLRAKIDQFLPDTEYLVTEPGIGYRMEIMAA